MDTTAILKNSVTQNSGNIEKAIIEIIDMRGRDLVVEKPVSMGGSSLKLGGVSIPMLSTASTFAGSDVLADYETELSSKAGKGAAGSGKMLSYLEGATRKCFYVQFNPAEVSVSGYGGGQVIKTNYSRDGSGISFDSAAVRIMMNVKLIFDKVDPADAFMSDKVSSSLTAAAEGMSRGIRTALGKKDNSVQTEVEGFIAALRSSRTRRITFHWGAMNYTGVLNRVSSQYTMFNVEGQPVRAVVALSLVCADQDVSSGSMGGWQEYYQKAFQGKDQSYVKAAQKAGNLLNINL